MTTSGIGTIAAATDGSFAADAAASVAAALAGRADRGGTHRAAGQSEFGSVLAAGISAQTLRTAAVAARAMAV